MRRSNKQRPEQWESRLALWLRGEAATTLVRPATQGVILLMFAVGVVAAGIPTGFLAHHDGAGVLGGVSWALQAAMAALPVTLIITVTAGVAGAYESGIMREHFLAGVRPLHATLVGLWGAGVATLLADIAALVGGAVAGAADALRQHSPVLGTWASLPLPTISLLAAAVAFSLCAALAAVLRRRALAGSVAILILALQPVIAATARSSDVLRWIAAILPFQLTLPRVAAMWYAVPVSTTTRLAVAGAWIVLGCFAVKSAANRRL